MRDLATLEKDAADAREIYSRANSALWAADRSVCKATTRRDEDEAWKILRRRKKQELKARIAMEDAIERIRRHHEIEARVAAMNA